ncbi:ribosome-recycling factor, mitochondrial [Polypterus senegalus]|uniref:ribosome-recycling factor, mitochondrial n=1 Tax=Polypterus senegalus TaxID=55291 RepID=UPI0019641FA1|nr:ribosome-recycling factor, mitochondrial [Polypterus senegalus]
MAVVLRNLCMLQRTWYRSLLSVTRSPPESIVSWSGLFQNCCRQCGALQLNQYRHLATKKTKAKGKGHPHARVSINSALVEEIINLQEVAEEMNAVIKNLEDYNKSLNIRTSPGALDHIVVATKDGKFPLNQIGQISMKSPQLILVNMSSLPEATESASIAIRESGMNLNPEVDGTVIKVPVPKVTREHREHLAKLAKQFTNKAKESLRKVRTNAISEAKKSKASVSEDTIKLIEKQIQQMTDDFSLEIEKQLTAKTKELLG